MEEVVPSSSTATTDALPDAVASDADAATSSGRQDQSENEGPAVPAVKTEPLSPEVDRAAAAAAAAAAAQQHDQQGGGVAEEEKEEDDYQPREPSYERANKVPFALLCKRFETLWSQRKKTGNKRSKDELLEYLLPKKLMEQLGEGSPFPILRLIMPEIDNTRPHNGMKEKSIANAWGEAMNLCKGSPSLEKLLKFHDPTVAGPTAAGDLSVALQEVMQQRYSNKPSKMTVGRMNELLDELARIKKSDSRKNGGGAASHDWRGGAATGEAGGKKNSDFKKKQKQRAYWVEKLIRLELSPLEHKWVVRILLQKLEIGIGYKAILKYYSPWAEDFFSANNNLKRLCTAMSDPEWRRRKKDQQQRHEQAVQDYNREQHLPKSREPASLGNTIAPMLALRTYFSDALGDIGDRHRKYVSSLTDGAPGKSSLALKHPAFLCEIKLDGERLITHIKRGLVTVQTRNSKWYSAKYSPVLGPPLRRALRYDVDVILDGEVVSWDNARKENIPFGANQTVAKVRREWLQRHGKISALDLNLHDDDEDKNAVSVSDTFYKKTRQTEQYEEGEDPGADCWLKLVLFDILYVGGPDAAELLATCGHLSIPSSSSETATTIPPGSIMNLDGYQRRTILQALIEPQDEVELVDAAVVRSDGYSVDAKDYFSLACPNEYGHKPPVLDSINCALDGIPDLAKIDKNRMNGRSAGEIEQQRAYALERLYTKVVEKEFQEGLVFKDLAAPYCFGDYSRRLGYWRKLKADYEKMGHASDLDCLVLGASYATGLGRSGLLSHFLLGCVDSNPAHAGGVQFLTLGKVAGGGTKRENLERLLQITGFKKASTDNQGVQTGKWFKMENHGRAVPDFISKHSFQRSASGDFDGWKFDRDKYPDLWIRPEDSFVLTINAGEIVTSDSFSAGVTLRFPRITQIRAKGFKGGPKAPSEVESVDALKELFFARQNELRDSRHLASRSMAAEMNRTDELTECRFSTAEQKKQSRKRKQVEKPPVEVSSVRIPKSVTLASNALRGYMFTVLEGTYQLDEGSLDAEEASEQGWLGEAARVSTQQDVVNFVLKHGGKCALTGSTASDFILGGRPEDARVSIYRRALESASPGKLNDKTKKGLQLRKMLELGGVCKWTFVFAAVHQFTEEMEKVKRESRDDMQAKEPTQEQASIKNRDPNLMQPRRCDYLAISKMTEEILGKTEDMYGMHRWENSNIVDFKRALGEAGRLKHHGGEENMTIGKDVKRLKFGKQLQRAGNGSASSFVPWQYRAFTYLQDNERWVFYGRFQKLWPYQSSGQPEPLVVLYPDLFVDFGFDSEGKAMKEVNSGVRSTRWDAIPPENEFNLVSSALPLAKAMGAQVTPHLHYGVTHVLCDLVEHNVIEWRASLQVSAFTDDISGKKLHERLQYLKRAAITKDEDWHAVKLVSPQWLKDKWLTH